MTAHSTVRDAVEAIQAGAADYVEKPIDSAGSSAWSPTCWEARARASHRILERRLRACVLRGHDRALRS
jgi:DNA-binding NtrC family response regulator